MSKVSQAQQEHALSQLGAESIVSFYRNMADLIVDFPDRLAVSLQLTEGRLTLVSEPCEEDASKLIGTKGAMFHSFRSVLSQLSKRYEREFHYQLKTKPVDKPFNRPKFEQRHDWPQEKVDAAFEAACTELFDDYKLTANHEPDKSKYVIETEARFIRIPLAELHDGLGKIWHAIGRANGRLIYLDALVAKE